MEALLWYGKEDVGCDSDSRVKWRFPVFIVLWFTVLLGCTFSSSTFVHADDTSTRLEKLNGGYYLLHLLCNEEAQLPLLLDVKHAPETIDIFALKISKTAKECNALLEKMHASDPQLNFDKNPLPAIEQDVRASIKDEKSHQLLFGTTDDAFVRALLASQIEASNYGHNLAKVLSEQESDPKRIKFLTRISAQWDSIHTEAFQLLASTR